MQDEESTSDVTPSTIASEVYTQEEFDAVTFTPDTKEDWWSTKSGAFVQIRSSDGTPQSRWRLISNFHESGNNVYRLLTKVPDFLDLSYKACVHGATPNDVLKSTVSINQTLNAMLPDRARDW